MNPTRLSRRVAPLLLAALVLSSCGGSSSTSTKPRVDPLAGAPTASSPANAVLRYAWAYDHLQVAAASGLLTGDFRFAFAAGDSAGMPYPGNAWALAQEVLSATHMFSGVDSLPPAHLVSMTLDPVLTAVPDARPGRNARWHQQIHSQVAFEVQEAFPGGGIYLHNVTGYVLFHAVRGDSAAIDSASAAAGVRADSTRWWIDRIEDETLTAAPGVHAEPTLKESMGDIKAFYLRQPIAGPRP